MSTKQIVVTMCDHPRCLRDSHRNNLHTCVVCKQDYCRDHIKHIFLGGSQPDHDGRVTVCPTCYPDLWKKIDKEFSRWINE